MLTLLGKESSINVRKVLWTCAELHVAYERAEAGSDLRGLNPNAMVPVLIDGVGVERIILWESNTICRYLAGAYGNGADTSLLPRAALARARVEQWMDWQATELNNAWRYAFMALVRQSEAHRDAAAIAASVAGWNRHMGILEDQLDKTGAYAAGADFSLADIVLGLSANRWLMTPMARPAYPAIDAYLARLSGRPAYALFCANGTP